MAKYVLNTGDDDFNFALIGITCAEDQYRLVSLINDVLNIDLNLADFLPLVAKEDRVFKFSLFKFSDEDLRLEFNLIPNTSNFEEPNLALSQNIDLFSGISLDESSKLIKELPKTDYFLILKGDETHLYQYKIIDKLKSISEIVQIQTIEPNDLTSKRNLIF